MINDFQYGNSQLLKEYRKALIKAYDLGEDIKEVYGIFPPKVMHDKTWEDPEARQAPQAIIVGLTVS